MATQANSTLPPNFDPFKQNFTWYNGNGDAFEFSVQDLDFLRLYGNRLAINYGSQVGASIILLLVLLLLTKREKRRSWIFGMNALCLVLNIIRSILQCRYLTGNFWNPYSILMYDTSHDYPQDKANTIASNTLTLLLVICVMISLSMQTWVVCITTPKLQRVAIFSVTTILALIAIGYRFAVVVISNIQTMHSLDMSPYQGLTAMQNIFQAIAIWSYCVVFTFKLGYALLQRRRLGMTQFGPMQIIFIMGAQTMVIPAIFTCLQFFSDKVPELGSQSLTIVCIFLPLSAIWAGVIANDGGIASSGADAHQRLLRGQFGRTPISSANNSRSCTEKGSIVGASSLHKEPDTPTMLYKENSADGGIHVDREFGVERGEPSTTYNRV